MRSPGLSLALALLANGVVAQQPRVAVAPDSVTVGGIIRVAVRIAAAHGDRVLFPDTLAVPADLEAAARLDLTVDSTDASTQTWTAVWALTAWRPGEFDVPPVQYVVTGGAGERSAQVDLPPVRVYSVLPEDTAGIAPMPPRDVIGADRLVWPLVLLAILVLAIIAAAAWAWRRFRPVPEPAILPPLPPRVSALLELDRLLERGLLERGDVKAHVFALTAIVRRYLADTDARLGTDLTTAELLARMEDAQRSARQAADAEHAVRRGIEGDGATGDARADDRRGFRIGAFLAGADLVKVARKAATAAQARADHERVRHWIAAFDWPPAATERAA